MDFLDGFIFINILEQIADFRFIIPLNSKMPNLFTKTLGTVNSSSDHVQTIKSLWDSFPDRQVFACNLIDANNFAAIGFIYGSQKYGAVLYLAFNECGIVKCWNGVFSNFILS